MCIGSILEIVPEDYGGGIIGCGFIEETTNKTFLSAEIKLVRGKLTAEKLGKDRNFPVGDPALIASDLVDAKKSKRKTPYKIRLVPHYIHRKCDTIKKFRSIK